MTWQALLITTSSGLSAIGLWFMYDVVREFKEFKRTTTNDVTGMKNERERFELVVRNYEVTLRARISELISVTETYKTSMERSYNIIDAELGRIRMAVTTANEKAAKFEDFMMTAYKLMNAINTKNKQLEENISLINKQLE